MADDPSGYCVAERTVMKKLFTLMMILAGLAISGCTVTETASERHRRLGSIYNLQARMAVEDWDAIWLQDRVTYLTPWRVREGLAD
jgi:hypothetical protein